MAVPLLAAASFGVGFLDFASSFSQSEMLKLQGEAARLRGKLERENFQWNAKLSDLAAQDVTARSSLEEGNIVARGRQVRGAQRAAAAASGVEVDSGSALQLQRETEFLTEMDVLTLRSNALRESFGLKMQSNELRYRGQMAELGGRMEEAALRSKARATLITGGIGMLRGGIQGASFLQGGGMTAPGGGASAPASGAPFGSTMGRARGL